MDKEVRNESMKTIDKLRRDSKMQIDNAFELLCEKLDDIEKRLLSLERHEQIKIEHWRRDVILPGECINVTNVEVTNEKGC